jgi:methylglutaconyl-CoA hydratase
MSEVLLYEVCEKVAVLTLNRADRRNALSRDLIGAIGAGMTRAIDDAAVRVILLTGAGASFCAGMDLAELQESLGADQENSPVWDDAMRLGEVYDRIYRAHKPTIAAVNGAAVAGGAGLVSVCDLALAVPEAKFGYPEVRRGLVAAMVLPHLMRHVGERMARWLLLTGELIDAKQALDAGFVNAICPKEELLSTAFSWAKSLIEGGPLALSKTKELLATFSPLNVSIEEAAKESAAPRLGEECRAGLAAFFAKRSAPWTS